ncbi:MFS transporter [Bacillus kwashiorkori]|uniref:MFS transporter n=1 Tax=Bacillus kwashiorkori TaxID=1522318 RepID=UPI0007843078|nr:MFS transporter [Bacillus kwashiorkori]
MRNLQEKYRWVIFFAVLFTYLMMSAQRTAPGLITEQLMAEFQVSAATVGLITSIQFFVYTGLQVPMGLLADRYGPNFFLIVGALLTGVGNIMYSLANNELIIFIARILTGVGDATIWVNLVLILGIWFTKGEFSRLIGVVGMTGSLGFLIATVPFSTVIELLGWRKTFFHLGVILCVCSFLLYFFLIKKSRKPLYIQNKMNQEKLLFIFKKLFTNRQAWMLFLCHFGIVGGFIGFISSFAVPFAMNVYGMTRLAASQLILLSLVGALMGAPIIGWISSQLGMIKRLYLIFYLSNLCCWIAILIFDGQPSLPILYFLFFMIGFSFGSNSLTFATVRQTFSMKEAGIVTGFANTGGFLSAVLLPSIFGNILDYFQPLSESITLGYYYGFFTPVIFCIIGLVGVCFMKEKLTSNLY